MANHGINWGPGAHVRFGDLDFIFTTEGELAQAPAAVQPLHLSGLDAIAETLEELVASGGVGLQGVQLQLLKHLGDCVEAGGVKRLDGGGSHRQLSLHCDNEV